MSTTTEIPRWMRDLPEEIIPFFEGIKNIPNANKGGCLWMCLLFKRWVVANSIAGRIGIVQYFSSESDVERNVKFILGDGEAGSGNHFTWTWLDAEYDADGEHYEDYLEGRTLPIKSDDDFERFCVAALNAADWNTYFSRREATKTALETLGIDMSDVLGGWG